MANYPQLNWQKENNKVLKVFSTSGYINNIYFIGIYVVDFLVSQTGHNLYLPKHVKFRKKTKFQLYNLRSHKALVR